LNRHPAARRRQIMVYGGDEPVEIIRRLAPEIRTMSRASIESWLIRYIGPGWTGIVPRAEKGIRWCWCRSMSAPGCGAGRTDSSIA
jgi:hypothetical protein